MPFSTGASCIFLPTLGYCKLPLPGLPPPQARVPWAQEKASHRTNRGLARNAHRPPKGRNDFQGESCGSLRRLTSKSQPGSALLGFQCSWRPLQPTSGTHAPWHPAWDPSELRDSPGSSLPAPRVHVHLDVVSGSVHLEWALPRQPSPQSPKLCSCSLDVTLNYKSFS